MAQAQALVSKTDVQRAKVELDRMRGSLKRWLKFRKLNDAMDFNRTELFEYFGLRTVYDRYLLKNPETREVTEAPQYLR